MIQAELRSLPKSPYNKAKSHEFGISIIVTFSAIFGLIRDNQVVVSDGRDQSTHENHRLTPIHWQFFQIPGQEISLKRMTTRKLVLKTQKK